MSAATKSKAGPKAKASSPKPQPELIPKRPEPWTVTAREVIRKNPVERQRSITVTVFRLMYRNAIMLETEGPTAEASLRNLAHEWNEKGILPVKLKKAAADMTEAGRRQMHIKNASFIQQEGFSGEAINLRELPGMTKTE